MPLNTWNIYGHELIGLPVVIERRYCQNSFIIEGSIINETKNMFVIMNEFGQTMLPKQDLIIKLTLPNKHQVTLEGKKLINRPEDRIKLFRRIQRLAT